MRILAAACEDDMVVAFLRAEISSERFAEGVRAALRAEGLEESAVEQADTSDPAMSARLRRVLARHRGYPDRGVFTGLPADTTWAWAALTAEELQQVRSSLSADLAAGTLSCSKATSG